MQWMSIVLWRCLALVFVALAIVGIALPVMPTVPFLIAALWAASKGWPWLETKLLNHPRYGADVQAWREQGCIRRKAKWAATLLMAASYIILWFMKLPPTYLKVAVGLLLAVVATWLWLRPEPAILPNTSGVSNENPNS